MSGNQKQGNERLDGDMRKAKGSDNLSPDTVRSDKTPGENEPND